MTWPADRRWEVLVVGAGPAGLAAAATAAESGALVTIVDRSPRPGGQYWRHGPTGSGHQHRWPEFGRLRSRLSHAGVSYLAEHHVQTVIADDGGWTVRALRGADPMLSAQVVELRARHLVLATGAYDRQIPFPGWDLPGVLAAGGAQALLKEHGVPAGRTVVVAGTGPFLLPVAAALLASGACVPLVVEANSPAGFARHPRAVFRSPAKLIEGAGYLARLLRGNSHYLRRHVVLRAFGESAVEAVEVARLDRDGNPAAARIVSCDALAVGWGFVPQLELHLQAGCATRLDVDQSLVVAVDDDQATSMPGVWAAGESTGVGGWQLSSVEGEIAGAAAAGLAPARALRRKRAALQRFAAAMHRVHPLPEQLLRQLSDDVLVCRCEEVRAGAIRTAVHELGASDARTVKLLTRAGMGWCQGRICGYASASMTAAAAGRQLAEGDLRGVAERPLAAPSRLRDLGRSDAVITSKGE